MKEEDGTDIDIKEEEIPDALLVEAEIDEVRYIIIIIIIIIIFINCNWVVTWWQRLFDTYTKYDIGLLLNLRWEGYMKSM